MSLKKFMAAICPLCLFACAGNVDAPSSGAGANPAAPALPAGPVTINADDWAPPPESALGAGVYPLNTREEVTIEINNLQNDTVFILQLNTGNAGVSSPQTGPVSSWHITGSAAEPAAAEDVSRGLSAQAAADAPSEQVTRFENTDALFFRGPPPFKRSVNAWAREASIVRAAASFVPDTTTKLFWVQRNADKTWYTVSATLRAKNERCLVWVDDNCYDAENRNSVSDNKINTEQARGLASKFLQIYEKETALLGFEYGGGPGGDGGADGLSEVQILVYDIDEDFKPDQLSGIIGFFWSKDENSQEQLDEAFTPGAYKTNEAEIFYIDSYFTDKYQSVAHSTLIHEFQHMIHYNQKTAKKLYTDVWYNEMLSMLAEDVLSEYIDISFSNTAHPVNGRIPLFLGAYNLSGPTDWGPGGVPAIVSYSSAYAFGAYLVRNFGGARLVKEMIENAFISEESVTKAVIAQNGGDWTFKALLEKYMETLVFNGSDGVYASFNRESKETVSETVYTFKAFDVYNITRAAYNGHLAGKGPYIFKPDESWTLRPGAPAVISSGDWRQVSGSMSIRLNKSSSDIKTYIILKRDGAAK